VHRAPTVQQCGISVGGKRVKCSHCTVLVYCVLCVCHWNSVALSEPWDCLQVLAAISVPARRPSNHNLVTLHQELLGVTRLDLQHRCAPIACRIHSHAVLIPMIKSACYQHLIVATIMQYTIIVVPTLKSRVHYPHGSIQVKIVNMYVSEDLALFLNSPSPEACHLQLPKEKKCGPE
jgi:hypothetical protein